jgi:hypothetical protein
MKMSYIYDCRVSTNEDNSRYRTEMGGRTVTVTVRHEDDCDSAEVLIEQHGKHSLHAGEAGCQMNEYFTNEYFSQEFSLPHALNRRVVEFMEDALNA